MIINQRYWGMTDSDVIGADHQYSFWRWVDWKTYPDTLRLARKSLSPQISTGTHLMFCQYDDFFYLWEGGNVYNNLGTNVYTLPWGFTIRNCCKFWDSFLMFYSTWNTIRIARAPFVWSSPNFAAVTVQWWLDENLTPFEYPFSTAVWPYCPLINDSEDILYFVAWEVIFRSLVTTLWFIQKGLTLEEPLVWLTKNWSQIAGYTKRGKKYFWDWFSKQHDGYVELWESIRYVQDTRNYDYIVAWTWADIYSKMYVSQWQDFQMIRKWSFDTDAGDEFWKHWYYLTWLFWNNCIATEDENVYSTSETSKSIECFWNKVLWLPKGTTIDFYQENVALWGMIRRKSVISAWSIWFSYENANWDCFVWDIQNFREPIQRYVPSWVLYTKKIWFWWYKMRPKNYRIRYQKPPWTTLLLYQSIDWSKTYTLVASLPDQETTDIFTINQSQPFYEIQRKIEMTTNNDLISPLLYSIEFIYEPADRQVK